MFIFTKLNQIRRTLINYIAVCWKFRKALAVYRPWDSSFIFNVAGDMYIDQARHIEKHANHVGYEKTARHARCIGYLMKTIDDTPFNDYYSKLLNDSFKPLWEWVDNDENEGMCKLVREGTTSERRRLDKEHEKHNALDQYRWNYLMKMIDKYHRKIWD